MEWEVRREPQVKPALWPLAAVSIERLFGGRDFRLRLDPDATILTGENGSGKSTVLRAVNFIGCQDWLEFSRLPLERATLHFADGATLDARHDPEGVVFSDGTQAWTFDHESALQMDPDLLHELRFAHGQFLAEGRSGRMVTRSRERRTLQQRFIVDESFERLVAPAWLTEQTNRFRTKLISARRLEHRLRPDQAASSEEETVSAVEKYAQDLRARMRDALSEYASESRKQERSLPAQIVNAMQEEGEANTEVLAAEVRRLQEEVRDLGDSLARVGLFYEEEGPEQQFPEYPEDERGILLAIREVYRVAEQRLQRLTGLRADLELFAGFLNRRLANKRIELNQDEGIVVVLENTQERISPKELSSGEQQLLALAYELLFGTTPESCVLLDEPELSLHVAWLKGLLSAFLEMGGSRKLQFVIATHSPSVIAGHRGLERSLDYPA